MLNTIPGSYYLIYGRNPCDVYAPYKSTTDTCTIVTSSLQFNNHEFQLQ